MGLTSDSTGLGAVDNGLFIVKESPDDKIIALAGNPNVGKSTVFNELTGLKQHTGNWPGKTVTNAQGNTFHHGIHYILVDIPGTYSLMAHSAEEEVARDFICFGEPDTVIVVCDATCLERNLNLVLQTIEITSQVVVCVNLIDEAEKKHIKINFPLLEEKLGVPVVAASARSRIGLDQLMEKVSHIEQYNPKQKKVEIHYEKVLEEAIEMLSPLVEIHLNKKISSRWVSLKLLDPDISLMKSLHNYLGFSLEKKPEIAAKIKEAHKYLEENGISLEKIKDSIVSSIVKTAEEVCKDVILFENLNYHDRDRKIDKILTSKQTGFPVMILLLIIIFWLTITGANYPSQMLSQILFAFQDKLTSLFMTAGSPDWLHGLLVLGMYRVLAWVVSVMLPPMAIFFPLFTLLEDLGYLPRIAFNLDKTFKKCHACGKQALTMCLRIFLLLTSLFHEKSIKNLNVLIFLLLPIFKYPLPLPNFNFVYKTVQ